ncbi:hypothetical protein HYPSUDRAFT_209557 [Hypholoma sublateritium FD-334 SS-4]|uniref:Uncharacterized protein n=1 Tax=Hypholoma sublateritium (strain FD-334 SS-4) TaxID=945553 RepID=A0A0D2N9U8_HYPSF|nr:hypothetical protein HYPSUDRAFT_209557 [Hypholoma sublateritium FD-334 SS-4]
MRPKPGAATDSSFSREIPPFYDYTDTSSQPGHPALLVQNEIPLQQPTRLLARQEIGLKSIPGPDRHQRTRIRFHGPSSSSRVEPSEPRRGPSSEPVDAAEPDRSADISDGLSSRSSSLPADWNLDTYSENDGLIPKPPGEKFIKRAVNEHLDPSIKFSAQPQESIKAVQTLAANKFSVLSNYSDWWPATDFIRAELHYTCSRARIDKRDKDAAIGKAMRKSKGKRKQ